MQEQHRVASADLEVVPFGDDCIGESTADDNGSYPRAADNTITSGFQVVSRGILDAQAAVACNETALVIGCTYTLTTSHDDEGAHGPAGLPIITTPITFEDNANTITRASTAATFTSSPKTVDTAR